MTDKETDRSDEPAMATRKYTMVPIEPLFIQGSGENINNFEDKLVAPYSN